MHEEFAAHLKCGRLAHGFLRVRCTACRAERSIAYSCKRRGFCPSCAARRMMESAALLVDEVLPREPVRQWVLSVPFPLRYLFATDPVAMGAVLGIAYRALTWARRLKRVFGIEIETCEQCGGKVKVIASIEDLAVIGRILGHLESRGSPAGSRPPPRGPPEGWLALP